MQLPQGVQVVVKKSVASDGDTVWFWVLKRWGKEVASSHSRTEKKMQKAVGEEIMKLAGQVNAASYERMKAKQTLHRFLERYPHAVAAITEILLTNASLGEVDDYEKGWIEQTPKQFRVPRPEHHRALTNSQLTQRVLDCFTVLKFVTKKPKGVIEVEHTRLRKWAKDMFGPKIVGQTEDEPEEVEVEEEGAEVEEDVG